ncbi:MAG TPA: SRPBCC domain-containing protein [Bauldia sp.]|nr:SRPBCC domain-containing protein [Bauldia sp.]
MSFKFTVSTVLPASPRVVYDTWLDSRGHGAMTGTKAKATTKVGGKWSATDAYCWGENLELVPGRKIVQSWRSADFEDGDADSKISVTLKPAPGGTKLILLHSAIPDSQKDGGYKEGWVDYYFDPMQAYFTKLAAKKPARKVKKK